jgi:hypothetical protein
MESIIEVNNKTEIINEFIRSNINLEEYILKLRQKMDHIIEEVNKTEVVNELSSKKKILMNM